MRTLHADLSGLQPCPEPRRWIIAAQDELILACPFHPVFALRMLEWARALSWPAEPPMLSSTLTFVCSPTAGPPSASLVPRLGFGASGPCHTWHKTIHWLQTNLEAPLWPAPHVNRARSLTTVGYALKAAGVACRPTLTHDDQAMRVFEMYVKGERETRRNLTCSLHLPLGSPNPVPCELWLPFDVRVRKVNEWRKARR